MKDKEVRVGDIIRNESVSDENPLRYSIVVKASAESVHCIYVRKTWEIKYADYYRHDVEIGEFTIIGHVDLTEYVRKSLMEYAFCDREKTLMHEKAMQDIKHEELQKKKRGV